VKVSEVALRIGSSTSTALVSSRQPAITTLSRPARQRDQTFPGDRGKRRMPTATGSAYPTYPRSASDGIGGTSSKVN
jgi:hypothetical protein